MNARRGSDASTVEQIRRVICTLAWFREHPDGSLMAAAGLFGVTVPQLRKELSSVQECGLPGLLPGSLVELDVTGTGVTLTETLGLDRAPALTATESAVIELNLEKLASILTDDEREDADSAAATIRSLTEGFPEEERKDADSAGVPNPDAAVLALLRDATTEPRKWVRFSYLSVSSDTRTVREIIPDQINVLGALDGEEYLWGRSEVGQGPEDQRCFAVSRMSGVEILDRAAPTALPRAVDAEDPFGFRDADQWAELTLTPDGMWMLEYLPLWHVEGCRVEIPDTGTWLERFLLAYAPEIDAVAPSPVANRTAQRAAAAVDAYRRLT